jgi:hypothetical protein
MPREFAAVNVAIWSDPEFCALPPAAQHLYLLLWTSPGLSHCGVHDWRPGRLAARSVGFTSEHITAVADCLVARYFLVVDEATEEVLVRSWGRFDGLMKQPRMAVSYANAFAEVASPVLRQVLAHETVKIQKEMSGLACWSDERVSNILSHPAVSAKDLPTPEDPFGDGLGSGLPQGLGMGLPQTQGNVWGRVSDPPTPAPTPAPSTSTPKERAPSKRGTAAPEDFEPNDTNRRLAEERGLDLADVVANFLDHHRAKGNTMVDWHLALNTWIRREKPTNTPPPISRLPHVSELEAPPNGLTDEQYDQWLRERQR